jgi:hypothetical protein
MNQEISFCIILQEPVAGVQFALQKGRGNTYETVQPQQSAGTDLIFTFPAKIKTGKDGQPDFSGPFVQGPVGERFVYIDIGTMAGQPASPWSRRLKVPLRGITEEMVQQVTASSGLILETRVPGTGKDGTPNCATVKPFSGWQVASKS